MGMAPPSARPFGQTLLVLPDGGDLSQAERARASLVVDLEPDGVFFARCTAGRSGPSPEASRNVIPERV